MARKAKEENLEDSTDIISVDSKDVLTKFVKDNKKNILEVEENLGISSGSIILDMELGGSLRPGVHTATGTSGGGKSSSTLSFMDQFLKEKNHKGIYVQAERVLSAQHKSRTSINFTNSPEDWTDQTCYLLTCNIFETVITLFRELVKNNPNNTKYFFVIDSMNALIPESDLEKSFSEANKVAGGALLSSDFLRRMSLAFSAKGHYCFLISQVRTKVKINQYEKTDPKLSNNSGGFAIDHYSDYVFEFQKAFSGDFIYKNSTDKTNPIGKFAKVILRKTNLENEGKVIQYPLRFGQNGKSSVWTEYEILNMLIAWGLIHKAGAWLSCSQNVMDIIREFGVELKDKFYERDFLSALESSSDLTKALFSKCKNLIQNGEF